MGFWTVSHTKNEERFVWLELETGRTLVFDRAAGRFFVSDKQGETNAFLMTTESFTALVEELNKLFGTGASVILERIGYGAGKRAAKHILLNEDGISAVKSIFDSASRWGFGKYELLELDPEKNHIRFRLHNCVLAIREYVNDCSNPMQYLIGFYKGYFSAFFRKELPCKEIRCVLLGDKYCEFELSPA